MPRVVANDVTVSQALAWSQTDAGKVRIAKSCAKIRRELTSIRKQRLARKMITEIGDYYIDESLLKPGGWALDAGCLRFNFAKEMASRGLSVVGLDPQPEVDPNPDPKFIRYHRVALGPFKCRTAFAISQDQPSCHIVSSEMPCHESETPLGYNVDVVTIDMVSATYKIKQWEAVKLDVEGMEYLILASWPGPIAKQICVEFHEHTSAVNYLAKYPYELILKHLGQWYDIGTHERSYRYCLPHHNYWSSLFILKPEFRES
jgi:FkbM family methyltransferase